MSGEPRGSGAEDHSRQQGEGEGERQHDQRRSGADGKEARAVKGEGEQEPRGARRHQQAEEAAADGEEDALREGLRDDLPARGAQGQPHRGLPPARDPASQEQVGHVRARDQHHQAAHRQEDLQAPSVRFLHDGDPRSRRDDTDDLLGESADHVGPPVGGIPGIVLEPMPQHSREARPHSVDGGAGPQPADHPEPRGDGLAQQAPFAVDQGLLLQRDPQIGRVALQSLAEESGGCDADHGQGMAVHDERRARDRGVGRVDRLPDAMAQDRHRRGGRVVVFGGEETSAEGAHAERREVAAGDVLGPKRAGRGFDALAADAQPAAPRLERGNLLELGRFRLEPFVQGEGEHPPSLLRSPFHAAVVAFAHAVEPVRIGDGQRAEHHGVDQREDRGGAADSQGQGQDGRRREHGRLPKLSEGIGDAAGQDGHGIPHGM